MKSKDKLIKAVSIYANRKGISADAAVSELNKMSKEEINNIFDKMKLFKDGGKLDYLLCLKKGGSAIKDCGCGGDVEKKAEGGQADDPRNQISWQKPVINGSDTTARGVNPYGQQFIARGTSDGRSLERITDAGSTGPIKTTWKQNPSLLDRILGVKKLTQDLDPILMQQDGGNLRRRDARENASENKGMNRRQFRQAYRNAKNSLRAHGPENLRGRELRQAAMHAFDLYEPQAILPEIAIEDTIPVINDAPVNLQSNPLAANYNFDVFSFNKAFNDARKLGLKTFNWRGADFSTQLADLNSAITVKAPIAKTNYPTINNASDNQVAIVSNPIKSNAITSDPWGEVVNTTLVSWTNPTAVQQSPDVTSDPFKLNNANFRRNRISFARFK